MCASAHERTSRRQLHFWHRKGARGREVLPSERVTTARERASKRVVCRCWKGRHRRQRGKDSSACVSDWVRLFPSHFVPRSPAFVRGTRTGVANQSMPTHAEEHPLPVPSLGHFQQGDAAPHPLHVKSSGIQPYPPPF